MSEWLINCADDLKSGSYYASVDIHEGEQPILVLFKKAGDKTIVVGQGELLLQHGRLVDARNIRDGIIQKWMDRAGDSHMYKCGMEDAYEVVRNAPTVIPASE